MLCRTIAAVVLLLPVVACTKAPPEPEATKPEPASSATKVVSPPPETPTPLAATSPSSEPAKPNKGGDPLDGKWTLADATKDLKGKGALVAKLETSKGALECKLFEDKAPITVANFVGLAMGTRPWKDPKTREWVSRAAYDGTTFHRVIKGFMIQGGDALGNGTGEPGYVIKDELWEGAKHDRPGLLCMANRGPNTNGAQFFITDEAAAHLDASYTIFGECSPVATVHAIASVPVAGEAPTTPVVIKSVKVSRVAK